MVTSSSAATSQFVCDVGAHQARRQVREVRDRRVDLGRLNTILSIEFGWNPNGALEARSWRPLVRRLACEAEDGVRVSWECSRSRRRGLGK